MKSRPEDSPQDFSVKALSRALFDKFGFAENTRIVLAYSGGCDSQVLLHGLTSIRRETRLEIVAAHFDHGLQAQSAQWAKKCEAWCDQLNVEFISVRRPVKVTVGDSVEANARYARYRWLEEISDPTQVVLTAHLADDQAETFLLNLFQGKGIEQLAGIAPARPITYGSRIQLVRPLLGFEKKQLSGYARKNGLQWIEDPSNQNTDFYRNYIRRELMPVMVRRNPGLTESLNRAADASRTITKRRNTWLDTLRNDMSSPGRRGVYCLVEPLLISENESMDEYDAISLIRRWIHCAGYASPSNGQLATLYSQICGQKPVHASLRFDDLVIRYYHGCLYLTGTLPDSRLAPGANHSGKSIPWDLKKMEFSVFGISVELGNETGDDIGTNKLPGTTYSLAWRNGGERVRLNNRQHRTSMKKLFQEKFVPPWERDNLPYLMIDNEIAWVHGIGWLGGFALESENTGICPQFSLISD